MPARTTLALTDILPVVSSPSTTPTNHSVSLATLTNFVGGSSVVEPSGSNDSSALQAAIDATDYYETLSLQPGAIYKIGAELAVTKPITIDMRGATFQPASGYTGYMMSVAGTNRGASDLFWVHPSQTNLAFRTRADNNGFKLKNGKFDGLARVASSGGIIFRGGNSDVRFHDVEFYGIKGTAMACCDPDSSTGLDADNQYMQECRFYDVHIKNCGDAGKPALLIGRNNNGASNHNNLYFNDCAIVYSRGANTPSISIVNKNTGVTNGKIQRIKFRNTFVHGNVSVATPDGNGEAVTQTADLVVVGDTGTVGRILDVKFDECRLIEQESGYACLAVNTDTDVTFNGHYIASASGRSGIKLNGAGKFVLLNDAGLDLEDHIEIAGAMASGGAKVFLGGNAVGSPDGWAGPNILFTAGSLDDVTDSTARIISVPFPGDASAADTTDYTFVTDADDVEMLVKAWFLPSAGLTADNTNFATIFVHPYNANGTTRTSHSITTETTGTGDWSARIPVDIEIPSNTLIPGALAFRITKTGTGVQLPHGVFCFQLSKQLYV